MAIIAVDNGFLLGVHSGGGKSVVMQISIVMLIYYFLGQDVRVKSFRDEHRA